jgi:AcrR family transcriptional regulator
MNMSIKEQDKLRIPQQQRSVQTKAKIVEAAVRLFTEKGYYQTNSKEIAKAAGVATGSFYTYFTDKREVFIEAYKVHKDLFNEAIAQGINQAIQTGTSKRIMLHRVIEVILNAHHYFDFLTPDLETMAATDQELQRMMVEYNSQGIQITTTFLKQMADELRVQDLEAAAAVIYFTMRPLIDVMAHKQSTIPDERITDQLSDMLTQYLFGSAE